jgi:predicted lipoprotein
MISKTILPRGTILTLCAVAVFSLSGCKLVKNVPEDEKAVSAGASGDQFRTEQRIAETFETQLLPYVSEKALSYTALRAALAEGLDQAGKAHGNRGSGQGAAWNFSITDSGRIVSAKLDTRARVAEVDLDGDGSADVTVQLGPVIRGNALRDIAPFYNFDDFRDQIEFAKLGRALNDQVSAMVTLPEGDLLGRTMSFTGVTPLKKADEAIVITPTSVDVLP